MLATATQRTLWCLARPRHPLVGFYPRTAAVYCTVLVCFFGPSAIGIILSHEQASGREDAWDAAEGPDRLVCLVCRMHPRFKKTISDTSMITGRPRTALILRPWNRIRAWGGLCTFQVQRWSRNKELQPSASPCGRAHLIADYTFAFSSKRMALPRFRYNPG